MTTTLTFEELEQAGERDLGATDWVTLDQERINRFAEATGDYQWIHVDPEMAAQGPFGGTIAHGYLSLSLLPGLLPEVLTVEGARMGINYGIDRIRFTAPVPVGSRVRVKAKLISAERRGEGVLYKLGVEVEIEGSEKPALVGEVLYLVFGG
jgi:acyl dehydratase